MFSIKSTNESFYESQTVELILLTIESFELLQTLLSEKICDLFPLDFYLDFQIEIDQEVLALVLNLLISTLDCNKPEGLHALQAWEIGY